ncbi:hypothetical protein AB205_0022190 [Aquarana catesbeiana]|uniref:Ectonucleoside triphosphate diphosphohydrolase 8 n=1 Tax=Aquarana catesbeiana TaxID=8400 RepID=A0A2G9SCM4_AQUCT|nr:hypothetical protein AB205_0022190 [Aquarana catesbeiana]
MCFCAGPGISSYANDPPSAGKSLVACLEEAMNIIPPEGQRGAPAYLGATAGMRLLDLENKTASDMVLSEVSKTISRYPYSFGGRWVRPVSSKIYGALDLGGASTQISFIPKVEIADPGQRADFKLYGFPYSIYTHSFLCYGQNQALKQMLVKAVEGKDLSRPINIPCYPAGYKSTIAQASLYNSPCTVNSAPSSSLVQNINIIGTGNSTQCQDLLKTIYDFNSCTGKDFCSFDGIYQPPVVGNFFAFSAFFYTFDFLNLTSGQDLPTVKSSIQTFCARDWTELQASFPKERMDRLRDYCANANYILTLLLDAYKFNENNWNSISFMKQAADTDIGWTLGYMLNLTNMIPSEAPASVRMQSYDVWIAAVFFIVLTLALGLLMLLLYCR